VTIKLLNVGSLCTVAARHYGWICLNGYSSSRSAISSKHVDESGGFTELKLFRELRLIVSGEKDDMRYKGA